MVREFSEEKRQEIFRILDEIDMKEWKPFMEWCGSSAEEFGDWPEKLNVRAYTRYVDEYHQKILDLNEMTRQQVNTVFENVAEINARYAVRMRECQEKIKKQIAMVNTMTEFMESMTDGNPNMALITKGSVNENCIRQERKETDRENVHPFNRSRESYYINNLYRAGWISEEEYRYLQYLLTTAPHVPESERVVIMGILEERLSYYRNTRDVNSPGYQWIQINLTMLNFYLEQNSLDWSDEIKQQVLLEYYDTYVKDITMPFITAGVESVLEGNGLDWERCQDLYDHLELWESDNDFHVRNDWLKLYNSNTFCDSGYIPRDVVIIDSKHRDLWCSYEAIYSEEVSYINPYGYTQMINRQEEVIAVRLENNAIVNEDGRYWIAVGPKLINENYSEDGKVVADDFVYGTYIDIIVSDSTTGEMYYIPCVLGDVKNHTYPDGQFHTGIPYPKSSDKSTAKADFSYVEFICAEKPEESIFQGLNLTFVGAIVYEKEE